MNHYLEWGYDAAFTENYPWRGLFGLDLDTMDALIDRSIALARRQLSE